MEYRKSNFGKGLILVLSFSALSCQSQRKERLEYPSTVKESQSKTYHGEQIMDAFSWLGDATTDRTKKWAADQDTLMRSYVRSWNGYDQLKEKVHTLVKVGGRSELPMIAGEKTFYLKDDSERGVWDLFVRENGKDQSALGDAPPFNPRAIYFYIPSPDGKYVATALAGRYFDWKVFDVEGNRFLDETLPGNALGGTRLAWSRDSKSFYYVGNSKTAEDGSRSGYVVKRHIPGQTAVEDKVVFTPDSDGSKLELAVCGGGDYLTIAEREGAATASKIHYMVTNSDEVVSLIEDATASFIFLGNDGKNFYFQTDDHAPKGRVVSINIDRPDSSDWKELIPEQQKPVMGYQSAGGTFLPLIAGNKFVIPYQEDLKQFLGVFDISGKLIREIELPSGGLYFNTNGLNALSGIRDSNKVLTRFIGITEPNTILEIDVNSGEVRPFSRAETNFDASQYVSEIVFSKSKDGTEIPISLTYKKGLKKNGQTPLIMQVYGAIAFTNYPYFQGDYITWLEMGGIHGVAHIRGGGAFGSGWHQAGIARNKQTGIDDYISAIEYVSTEKYSSPEKIIINGVSAGTIPVAAVLTQKPEIFGAAVLHYGMLDMISYAGTFAGDSNHAYMIPELGTASNKEDFDALKKYSPYQKLSGDRCYPPVLALTSEADTPLDTDSYRFIAALQNLNSNCTNEYLLQMAWGSGHSGFGSQTHSPIDTFTDEIAFLIKSMNLDVEDWLKN